MRKLLMAAAAAAALAAAGCTDVLSLNPWVEGEGLTDPQFAGSWTSDGGDVFVIQAGENNTYDVLYVSDKESTRFEGRLLAAGNARFFDLTPTKGVSLFAWPAHALVKVWFEGEDLNFAFVDSEWFRELAGNLAVAMQKIDNSAPVLLTAPTATLSDKLLQHAADPQAISQGGDSKPSAVKLHRLK